MKNHQPAYLAYVVKEGEKDYWTRIGAAFAHKDGEGLNLILQALPVNGRLVLRRPEAKNDE